MTPVERLHAQNAEFTKGVVQLNDRAFLAVGYAASNVGLLLGEDGAVVIDSTEATSSAREILQAFRAITPLPIRTVIVTHGHRDHVGGLSVFAGPDTDIIAHSSFVNHLTSNALFPNQLNMKRTRRQFGAGLVPGTQRINIGAGPAVLPTEGAGAGFREPTRFVTGPLETIETCGLTLKLIAAPGETVDHMIVWHDADRVLFCGDNYYSSFPNLYAIRGTPYRDFSVWAKSLDTMIELGAEILAPGHTRPVMGATQVRKTLTAYRDAILAVIDKTIEGMNRELSIDDLVEYVKLPPELAELPFLQEVYGTVEYAVRAYYAGTMGWFDGNPTNLRPLASRERAHRIAQLAGGEGKLLEALQDAMRNKDFRWAAELADHLIVLGTHAQEARRAKQAALREMAQIEGNAPVRNYLFVSANELDEAAEGSRDFKAG